MIPPYIQNNLKRHYEASGNQEYLVDQAKSNERSQKARSGKKEQEERVGKISYEQLTGRKADDLEGQ